MLEFISGNPLRRQGEIEDHRKREEKERDVGANDDILNMDSEPNATSWEETQWRRLEYMLPCGAV